MLLYNPFIRLIRLQAENDLVTKEVEVKENKRKPKAKLHITFSELLLWEKKINTLQFLSDANLNNFPVQTSLVQSCPPEGRQPKSFYLVLKYWSKVPTFNMFFWRCLVKFAVPDYFENNLSQTINLCLSSSVFHSTLLCFVASCYNSIILGH